jgi:hypothetical protein
MPKAICLALSSLGNNTLFHAKAISFVFSSLTAIRRRGGKKKVTGCHILSVLGLEFNDK